eukprot:CAMPEP_0182484374 /NCGR_PEP_ID=MMETSP1319-20130603/43305_1 /TAXON_ID=172717 /ORGANISM="Bolidomonas pacifica, Strain RCC208" /LENGTH=147 /DNA_ID=CAMNT_0024686273 /DNA_START=304 /DNA_END=744 /DNA_ORIENTATION=+
MQWSQVTVPSPSASASASTSTFSSQPHPVPTPTIKNHSVTLYNNKLYVFGGYDGRKNHNSLRTFDCSTMEWSHVSDVGGRLPPGRNGHTATLAGSSIIIIGGWLGSGPLAADDCWSLDLHDPDCPHWSQLPALGSPPGPCNMHSSDY